MYAIATRGSTNSAGSTSSPCSSTTIYALATGPLTKAGVCIVRLSGECAFPVLETLLKGPPKSRHSSFSGAQPFPKSRFASLRYLYTPDTKEVIDKAIVLTFPGPRSFTGEDVVEFHLHGSKSVIQGLVSSFEYIDKKQLLLPSANGSSDEESDQTERFCLRPAERGEFSQRAFENGRMDLTEVEGLADLIDAETPLQRKQAFGQMEGQLRLLFEEWREELIRCLAHTEAVIDFGDDDREDDVNEAAFNNLVPKVQELRKKLLSHVLNSHRGEMVRDGVNIALVGPPNAGKSSLINALAGRPAAIVSHIAGTTRDVVEVKLNLAGVPCIVRDTAGIREGSTDVIELEGIKRSKEAFHSAEIKILVVDFSSRESIQGAIEMTESLLSSLVNEEVLDVAPTFVVVRNKVDLIGGKANPSTLSSLDIAVHRSELDALAENVRAAGCTVCISEPVSCVSGEGVRELEGIVAKVVAELLSPVEEKRSPNTKPLFDPSLKNDRARGSRDREHVLLTRARHRRHVEQCIDHLDNFLTGRLAMDAAAEELRLAMMELGKVTGVVDVEEVLDVIFRDFCIGK